MKTISLTIILVLFISQLFFAQLEYPGSVDITGSVEVVFNSTTDSCSSQNIPDAPIRAFRDVDNNIQIIVSHFEGYRMKGADFNSLSVDCANGPVWTSNFDSDPSKYNNKEWLTGLYTLDGETIYSLVHNEHQGSVLSNWYNSITLAVSNDTGKTYSQSSAPNHLVASIPYKYTSGMGPAGVFEPSNIIYHDDYYYVLLHMESFGLQKTGVSIMRTQDISNPTSWEVWDGEGYSNSFINPYTETSFNPAEHIGKIIALGEIEKMHGSITWNTYFNKFLLVGSAQKNGIWGFYYSLSEDLIHWSVRKKIMEANLNIHAQASGDVYGYPSIIDHNDTTRNFEVTGQEVYLYYSKWPYGENYNRKIERLPIRFNKLFVDGFVVDDNGDDNDANNGDGIASTSSGKTSLRSAIVEANFRPIWYRDSVITISFNISGTGVQSLTLNDDMPDIWYPVKIDGYTQPGAKENTNTFTDGSNAEPLILINANGNGGILVEAPNTTIRGLVINNHNGPAININGVSGCSIDGNFLGTSANGLTNVGDDGNGLFIDDGQDNSIGGDIASKRNVILGGITIMGNSATGNVIAGNYIGTDKTGTVALSKNSNGVQIIEGANSNTIGGEYSSSQNLISGNALQGIWISGGGVEYNSILNNFIGTDASGGSKLPNTFSGVYIADSAKYNSIGQVDAGNVISGNTYEGVVLENCSNNFVQENFIGTDITRNLNMGNGSYGVFILNNSENNMIGGSEAETGNTIAFNSNSGVAVSNNSIKGNAILRNSIYQNGQLGIDIFADGAVNENILTDYPGGTQNFPEIKSAQVGDSLIVSGVLWSIARNTRLQFFISDSVDLSGYGEGQIFIGEKLDSAKDSEFTFTFVSDGYIGKYITATATDSLNTTSEFSKAVLIRESSPQIKVERETIHKQIPQNSNVELELYIYNRGAKVLNWSTSSNESWLNLSVNSGTIYAKGNDKIIVGMNTNGLQQDTYYDTIKIVSNDPIDSVLYIPVTLNVTRVPTKLGVSADSIWVACNKGESISKTFYITNKDSSQVNWSITTVAQRNWMSLEKQNGTLLGNKVDTITIDFNTTGLQNGNYPNTLNVYSNEPNNVDYSIKVLMVVDDYPTIEISSDTIKFVLKPNEEKTVPLTIKNKGKVNLDWDLNWTYYYSPWIKPSLLSGILAPNISGVINIKVSANDLDSTYSQGALMVRSNDPNYKLVKIPVVAIVVKTTEFENVNENLPTEYSLQQNYPNPFNPTTTINYSLPVMDKKYSSNTNVFIKVYNVLGKEVVTLVNKEQSAGNYSVVFDAKDLPSGVYIYSIKAGGFTSSKKFILMK